MRIEEYINEEPRVSQSLAPTRGGDGTKLWPRYQRELITVLSHNNDLGRS